MKQNVLFYSQYDDVSRDEWKDRSCSVTCLAMALRFFGAPISTIDSLIDEGLTIGARDPQNGWIHGKLAILAHNYGIPAYAEEFRSATVVNGVVQSENAFASSMNEYGLEKIVRILSLGGLVIASVPRNLDIKSTFHSILLIGYEEKDGEYIGFYYHDPDTLVEKREGRFISKEDFSRIWRKMAIYIGKNT